MIASKTPLDTGHPWTRFIKEYDYNHFMDSQTNIFRYLNQQEHSSISDSSVSPLADKAKKEYFKNYYKKNKEKIYNYQKQWKKLNLDKVRGYYYNKNKICLDCQTPIPNKSTRCLKCANLHNALAIHESFKNKQKHKDLIISKDAEQVIIGSLLGDASTTTSKRKVITSIFCMLKFTHCLEQTNYFNWKAQLLNLPSITSIHMAKQNGSIINYKFNYYGTKSLFQLLYYHNLFYPNGKKVVTREILDRLEPLGLAVWYMDDGNYDVPNANIYTNCFGFKEQKIIQTYFKEKWNLNVKIRTDIHNRNKPTYSISFDANSSRRFFDIIKPFVPESMVYKLVPNPKRVENKKIYYKQYILNIKINKFFKLIFGESNDYKI